MVFPVVMYGCESWTIKKSDCQGSDAFELWCWRRLLRVHWIAGRSNQPILKEINLEYSLKGLLLKLQYFGHLMQSADSLEKTLMLGKIEGKRRGKLQRMRCLDCITNSMDMNLNKLWETVEDRRAQLVIVQGVAKSQTWLSDGTTTTVHWRYWCELMVFGRESCRNRHGCKSLCHSYRYLPALSTKRVCEQCFMLHT